MQIKEKITDTIFDLWTDGVFGCKTELEKVQEDTIDKIMERYSLPCEERFFIESNVMASVCMHEKNAFYQGFSLGLDLMLGKLFN